MIWDCHVHAAGTESAKDLLAEMDERGIDRMCLFGPYRGDSVEAQRESTDFIAALQAEAPDRLFGLAWLEPALPGAADEVERAIADKGLRGIKMIPNHWYPTDDLLVPVYERVQQLGVPIQFHSGILYGMQDSSRFCQPVYFETLVHFPKVRFSLAHISWPWCDECIAVFGRFRANVRGRDDEAQMWIDTTRGTPPEWRLDALRKAVAFGCTNRMLFGSDAHPGNLAYAAEHIRLDIELLRDEIGLDEAALERYFWGNCAEFYGVPD
ncbi:MAG: amidohydrolase family protein [Armatimonadetes bacterium]|nr:amidohydrolase family protein [Armatimonadota bacterium]